MRTRTASRRRGLPGAFSLLATLLALMMLAVACGEDVDEAVEEEEEEEAPDEGGVGEEAAIGRATIGTHAIGGGYHAVGSGVAAAVSANSDLNLSVQPYGGPSAWLPELNAGDLGFGLVSTVDAGWAYTAGPGFDEVLPNVRTVLDGNDLFNMGVVAPTESGIETHADFAGQDVGSEFAGNIFSHQLVTADLASGGVDWEDVNPIPQPDPFVALEAMQAGEIVGTAGLSPNTPAVMELAEAVGGLNPLPFAGYEPADIEDGIPDEAQEILDEYVDGATLATVPEGVGILEEDTVMFAYGLLMVASVDLPEDLVYGVLDTLWEHYEEVHGVHPWADDWHPDRFPTTIFTAPYHDGAIEFYEDQGVWTDEHQERQEELLELH